MKINFGAIKKVLGVITDILLIGRGKGWWSQKNSVGSGNNLTPPGK